MPEKSPSIEDLELQRRKPRISENIDVQNEYLNENINQYRQTTHDPHSVSWRWGVIFIGFGCFLYYLIYINDNILPTPIREDQTIENPKLFSAERSRSTLRKLTAIGPRSVGDNRNEIQAPAIIVDEVKRAKYMAHPLQKIHIERQSGSGAYVIRRATQYPNIYINIQNVLVMIEGSEGNHSILVNCHFDTVPQAQGASDDGISCAVMIELIRVLSLSPTRLKHNIIFLFNGAEETVLQGSHLFLQHEWKNKTRMVINLEAAGSGGRSILFQSGPKNSWITNYYAKHAPHPHAQVLAEEMFQAGFIPSDTDFRIFRDFGRMPGLDFAFCRYGHVYHTKYDTEEYIPLGSYQHVGDNTLALLTTLGNADEFNNMEKLSEDETVYYDYLGWFIFIYSKEGGIALNIFTILLAIFSVIIYVGRLLKWSWLPESTYITGKKFEKLTFNTFLEKFKYNRNSVNISQESNNENRVYIETKTKTNDVTNRGAKAVCLELGIAIVARIAGMGAAIVVTVIIAAVINSGAPLGMPWYSNVWLIFPLYWCPCLVTFALVPHLFDIWRSKKHGLSLSMTAQMNLIAAQIPWIVVYFVLTCAGIRSSSIFFIPVFCTALANIVIYLTPLYLSVHKWVWIYLLIHLPALLMNLYLVLLGYIMFTPIVARSGVINADLYISIVTSILCLFVSSYIIPLFTLIRKPGIVLALLSAFSIVMIILSWNTNIGLPYNGGPVDPKPQRYWIMHTLREFRNESGQVNRSETGYFIINQDGNSPRTIPLKGRTNIRSLKKDCETEFYCGLPLYLTKTISLSPESSWIPASPPYQPTITEIKWLDKKRNCNNMSSTCTYRFNITGPDRMTLTFSPREGASLIEWSIPTEIVATHTLKNRLHYFMHIVHGRIDGDFHLKLTFKVSQQQLGGKPIFDIGLTGNHVHHDEMRTSDFQQFLNSFPDWTDLIGWISAYKAYIF